MSFLRKKYTIAVAVVMLAILLGSYSYLAYQQQLIKQQQQQTLEAKQNDSQKLMTYLQVGVPEILGFPQVRGPANRYLYKDTFETLATYEGSSLDPKPRLAERWEISPDGKVYTFYLRKNVTFYPSGDPFNAQAVKFSLDSAFTWPFQVSVFGGPDLLQYNRTEIIDSYTVKIYINRPLAWFMRTLTYPPIGSIMNPKFINAHGGIPKSETTVDPYLIRNQDVTGPYIVEDFKPGDRVILKRNPTYWGGWTGEKANYPERVVMRNVPEAATRMMLLGRGDADIAQIDMQYLPELKQRIQSEKLPLVIDEAPNMRELLVLFDQKAAPTNDVHVRRALAWSFDYDKYIGSVMYGFGTRLITFVPKGMWGYQPDVPYYTFNLDKAKAELALAKPENVAMLQQGIKITYTPAYAIGKDGYLMWKSDLAKIGVNLILDEVSSVTYTNAMRSGGVAMLDRRWTMDFPDPASFYAFLPKNYYESEKFATSPDWVGDLLAKTAFEVNQDQRLKYYRQIEEWAYDSVPYIKVASPIGGGVYNVRGGWVNGYSSNIMEDYKPIWYGLWKGLPAGQSPMSSISSKLVNSLSDALLAIKKELHILIRLGDLQLCR
jgi:peptide/nickel transport system substrate-binding protein